MPWTIIAYIWGSMFEVRDSFAVADLWQAVTLMPRSSPNANLVKRLNPFSAVSDFEVCFSILLLSFSSDLFRHYRKN